MKTIFIEVSGGIIIRISEVLNAPKEGVIIVDHDNIKQVDDPRRSAEFCFDNFYETDSVVEFEDIRNEILKEYGGR